MKARSADLSTLFEGVKYRYERLGKPLPLRWRLFNRAVSAILFRGQ